MSKEYRREHGLWSGYQTIFSLTILTIFCVGFYLMGLYIGRWSNVSTASSANAEPKAQPPLSQPTLAGSPVNSESQPSTAAPGATGQSEKYSVRIASVNSQAEADEMVKRLRRAGFDSAHVAAPEPNSVDQLYVVSVGPYKLEIAHQVAEELQREHGFKDVQVMPRQVE